MALPYSMRMHYRNAIGLVFATAVISGFSIFFNKYALAEISPTFFTFLKNLVVGIFLLGLLFFTREIQALKKLSKTQWVQLIFIGLIGGAIPFVLFFNGLSMVSAASGSFVHKTLFIFASILAVVFLKEKINKPMIVAAGMLLAGNFLLLKMQFLSFGMGELLIFIAVLFWAAENVLSKYVLKELSGTLVGAGRMAFGGGFILLYLLFTGGINELFTLNGNGWMWVLITSALLAGYVFTYYNGLKHLPVSTASSILLLGSPITTLLSVLVTGANVTMPQIGGIALLLAGIGILVHQSRAEHFKHLLSLRHTHNG